MTRKRRRTRSLAARANRYELYQQSVQEPEADFRLIERAFRREHGRPPRLLREDFCGAALIACEWVKRHAENRAWAIDLDPAPLAFGRAHNLRSLTNEQASRVKLIEGDVRDVGHAKVDVTAALNFSYFLFQQRGALLEYFRRARATLLPGGMLLLDVYGGADSWRTLSERRRVNGFDYVWNQQVVDPITNRVVNTIDYEFRDGSWIRRAFRYDWRLWTIPELRELLAEAGFAASHVYWEGTDSRTGKGNDVFTHREHAPDDPAWIAYVIGLTSA
jgi:cyclopropane fatty-acyl-phospholipid synthase-like methyltransferase